MRAAAAPPQHRIVPLSADGGTASAACSFDTEIALLGRQSVSVRDPNEQHIIDSFETSHRGHDGAQ